MFLIVKELLSNCKRLLSHISGMVFIALMLTACASNTTTNNNQAYRSSIRSDTSYNQSRSHSGDIWQRVRNGFKIPDLYNEEVVNKENYYAQRADYVGRMASRAGDFMYLIMNEVERRNMPSEIALLPFVESAFVTTAQSPVKAAGLWQFMPATGRDFSLQQNHFADQRNDVIASTDAALTFLQRLYDQFGDWHLALAAYNWGPGNVTKAVNRAQAAGFVGGYQDIKMPTETRQYVPKLQAIKNIVNNPSQYGITLPNISNNLRHEAVTVTRDIDVATAARLSGLDIEGFKRINPAYKKSVIAASLGSKILVPVEYADKVRSALRDTSQTLATLTIYSTYNTEALDDIAYRFDTSADNLRYLNNIPSFHNYVKAGSALLVPRISNKSGQDIPYEALTAGLSTTSGGVGLGRGDYIEQPTLIVSHSDERTRQERSGIISSFPTKVTNNGIGLVANNNGDDDLGLLIKNTPTNDPVVAQNALIVTTPRMADTNIVPIATAKSLSSESATNLVSATPTTVEPSAKPTVISAIINNSNVEIHSSPGLIIHNSPVTASVSPSIDATSYSTVHGMTTANSMPQSNEMQATPVLSNNLATADNKDAQLALAPFVATVVDEPEVIASSTVSKVAKPKKMIEKVAKTKSNSVVAQGKTERNIRPSVVKADNKDLSKGKMVLTKSETTKSKATKASLATPVANKSTNSIVGKPTGTTKVAPPVKPAVKTAETAKAKAVESSKTKVSAQQNGKTKNDKPIQPTVDRISPKATLNKATDKKTSNKPTKETLITKTVVASRDKTKKVIKK